MPLVGHYKTVAILFVSLCTLASFFYLTVWSSIAGPDPNSNRHEPKTENDLVHRPVHVETKFQEHVEEDEKALRNSQGHPQGSYSQTLVPTTSSVLSSKSKSIESPSSLAHETKPIQLVDTQLKDKTIPKPLSKKQRAKELKRLAKLEREERKRLKEERRRRKEAKMTRLRLLEQEPFPRLISTNNARLAALNLGAFSRFCHESRVTQNQDQGAKEKDATSLFPVTGSGSPIRAGTVHPNSADKEFENLVLGSDIGTVERVSNDGTIDASFDFESYEEWIEYIENKNSGQEQSHHDKPTLSPLTSSQTFVHVQKSRPQFLERPLRGWIVNMTAIQASCDRTRFSSAQCLHYLTQEHLYLIPSRETRLFPNRIFQQKQRHRLHRHRLLHQHRHQHHHHHRLRPSQQSHAQHDHSVSNLGKDKRNPAKTHILQPRQRNQPKTKPLDPIEAVASRTLEDQNPQEITSNGLEDDDDSLLDGSDRNVDPHTSSTWMNFHIYWRGPITDKLALSAKAFLFTQPLDRARLHLWIDSTELPGGIPENYEANAHSQILVSEAVRPYIRFHVWDQSAMTHSAYGNATTGSVETRNSTPSVALSDEARFLILNRYGGMYLDADVLLLRDMSPFYDTGLEFAYEWSNTKMYNTAVLRLHRHGSVGRRILDGAKLREKELSEKQNGKKPFKGHDSTTSSQPDPKQTLEHVVETVDGQDKGQASDGMQQLYHKIESSGAARPIDAVDSQELRDQVEATMIVHHPPGKEEEEDDEEAVADLSEEESEEYNEESLFAPPLPVTDDGDEKEMSMPSLQSAADIASHRLVKREGFDSMRPKEIYHPARIRHYLRPEDSSLENNGLIMVQTAVFDPLWLRVDGADQPSQPSAQKENSSPKDPSPSQGQDLGAKVVNQENEAFMMMPDLTSFPDAFSNMNAVCPKQLLGREPFDRVPLQQEATSPREERPLKSRSNLTSEPRNVSEKNVHDKEKDFSAGPEVFFMGAYAYHWHNNWKSKIEPQSWMGLMSRAYDQFLEGERPNLYGEWFRGGGVELDSDFTL